MELHIHFSGGVAVLSPGGSVKGRSCVLCSWFDAVLNSQSLFTSACCECPTVPLADTVYSGTFLSFARER